MAIRPAVVVAVICVGLFSILECCMWPKAMALTFNRKLLQTVRDKENFQKRSAVSNPEMEPEQQAVIMDEGIDDDMDYLFEILPKKRGGISQFENQALPDHSCEYTSVVEDYGVDVFPRKVAGDKCRSEQSSTCHPPFKCQEVLYEVPFLRSRPKNVYDSVLKNLEKFSDLVPSHLRMNWYAEYRNVSVGCQCSKTYLN